MNIDILVVSEINNYLKSSTTIFFRLRTAIYTDPCKVLSNYTHEGKVFRTVCCKSMTQIKNIEFMILSTISKLIYIGSVELNWTILLKLTIVSL